MKERVIHPLRHRSYEALTGKVPFDAPTYNALLFDFVAKRALRSRGKALPARVFETRGFFMRSSGNVG